MNQIKIGCFLKNLRKEKGITQEQLAEAFSVSNRTVSRWENGNNMPDLDILVGLSDYFGVELRELLDGDRKGEKMGEETKETALKAVNYSNSEAEKSNKRVYICNGIALLLLVMYLAFEDVNALLNLSFLPIILNVLQGMALGMILVGLVFSSKYGAKLKSFKKRIMMRYQIK